MITPNSQFVANLLRVAPGFEPVYREHLRDQGQLLPHVLMGDFTRWFIDQARAARTPDAPGEVATDLRAVTAFLDAAFRAGRPETQELLAVSFLENLHQADDDYELVKSFLGPLLRRELEHFE